VELLQALGDSGLAAWLRRPGPAYPLASAAHILSLGCLIGAIVLLDLRLLGLFRRHPLAVLGPLLSRAAAAGLALAIATGVLLISVRPIAYIENPALRLKLLLVALGIANALAVRLNPAWRTALAGGGLGASLRVQAGLSLAIWVGAVLAGRWIGFLM
jgi:hypothetical protein